MKAMFIRICISLHPWIAGILTRLPCYNWSSRLLDKLIVMTEVD